MALNWLPRQPLVAYKSALPGRIAVLFVCLTPADNMWQCFMLLMATLMPVLITSESENRTRSSLSDDQAKRTLALQCTLDEPNCSCSMQPPGPLPEPKPHRCIWDDLTCECGWDLANTGLYIGIGPPLPAAKTCVVDQQNCKCMAGSLPLVPPATETTTLTFQDLVASAEVQILDIKNQLLSLVQSIQQKLNDLPRSEKVTRAKLIVEVEAVVPLLRDAARKALHFKHLQGSERNALVARLREEIEYLGKIRDDPVFMAAQIGRIEDGKEQPIVLRLRKVLVELENALPKVS